MRFTELTSRAKALAAHARTYAADHPEVVDKVVTRAGDVVDSRTGRKYSARINAAQQRIKKSF